jgi:galactokinase
MNADRLDPAMFERWSGRRPRVMCDAGGRVNLIGEHTDYHDGYVLPAAIDLRTRALGADRDDAVLRVRSLRVQDEVSVALGDLEPLAEVSWRSYVLGPFWALRASGTAIRGADVLVDSDVPFGGGLSSSASVQVALVGLAASLAGATLAAGQVAKVARKAENEFCRVPCGAMDQMASACGRQGHALLLDCRTLQWTSVRVPESWAIVVADSGVKHSLASSEYARRQEECARGIDVLRRDLPAITALRDVTEPMVQQHKSKMPEVVFRRLRHVVTENTRVLDAQRALQAADAEQMGRLLEASHRSLASDYEVSCPELDELVDIAHGAPGVIGARLTGAGFGGNTVNLVHAGKVAEFCEWVRSHYEQRTGRKTVVHAVSASSGLRVTAL